MPTQIKTGRFIAANDNPVYLDIGFIPDYFKLLWGLDDTKAKTHYWWREQYIRESADKYGLAIDGDGTKSTPTSAATGISPWTTEYQGVWIPHPALEGQFIFRIPAEYVAATDYSTYHRARAGSTVDTAIAGDVIWPTTRNSFVYECTTAGGVDTEPTWPVIPGVSVDAGNNVWICRKERSGVYAPKGVLIGESLMVDSDVCLYKAILGIDRQDHGDAENFYGAVRTS